MSYAPSPLRTPPVRNVSPATDHSGRAGKLENASFTLWSGHAAAVSRSMSPPADHPSPASARSFTRSVPAAYSNFPSAENGPNVSGSGRIESAGDAKEPVRRREEDGP